MTGALRKLLGSRDPGLRSPGVFAGPGGGRGALFTAAVVLGPALLFCHLHGFWNPNGEYSYGWVVPLLAAFLYKSRWQDRPTPSVPVKYASVMAIILALLTLPARWLQEAAPERGICTWSYAAASVGTSLLLISIAGGLPWLCWFGFPFAFILTAVPWPRTFEILVSNCLMRGMAGATVEILCLIGIPSGHVGNLVHIENGVIDIDEACSGIRSLQAMVMISLFLGELFRLRLAGRVLLLAVGLAVTLLANVIRTVSLSIIGFGHGMGAVDRYHDVTGLAVLILSLSGALLTASMLRPAKTPAPSPGPSGVGLTLPIRLSCALLTWLFAEEISVETWYRLREPKWQGWSWAVQWPQGSQKFQFIEIPKRSLQVLMSDEAHAGTWKEADGSDWSLYWIRWNPGNPAAETAKAHRPDVCLNAEGAIMEKDMGMHISSVDGMDIPFHSYVFRLGEKKLHVFFSLCEEMPGVSPAASLPEYEGVDMFLRALKGRRHIGNQSLELAVSGYRTELAAQEAFEARLGQLLQVRKSAIPSAGK